MGNDIHDRCIRHPAGRHSNRDCSAHTNLGDSQLATLLQRARSAAQSNNVNLTTNMYAMPPPQVNNAGQTQPASLYTYNDRTGPLRLPNGSTACCNRTRCPGPTRCWWVKPGLIRNIEAFATRYTDEATYGNERAQFTNRVLADHRANRPITTLAAFRKEHPDLLTTSSHHRPFNVRVAYLQATRDFDIPSADEGWDTPALQDDWASGRCDNRVPPNRLTTNAEVVERTLDNIPGVHVTTHVQPESSTLQPAPPPAHLSVLAPSVQASAPTPAHLANALSAHHTATKQLEGLLAETANTIRQEQHHLDNTMTQYVHQATTGFLQPSPMPHIVAPAGPRPEVANTVTKQPCTVPHPTTDAPSSVEVPAILRSPPPPPPPTNAPDGTLGATTELFHAVPLNYQATQQTVLTLPKTPETPTAPPTTTPFWWTRLLTSGR